MRHEARVGQLLQTAEAHTRARRWRRAVVAYRKVLRLAPAGDHRHELAQARLADLHVAMGQPERAVPHLKRAQVLAAEPEPEYALMLGHAFEAKGQPLQAAEALHDAVSSPTHGGPALRALARLLAADGDRAAGRRLAAHAAARGDDPQADRRLARDLADA